MAELNAFRHVDKSRWSAEVQTEHPNGKKKVT